MYYSTKKAIDNLMENLNNGKTVYITDGTVTRTVDTIELFDNTISINIADGHKNCIDISTDDIDKEKIGIVEIENIFYIAPMWWIK